VERHQSRDGPRVSIRSRRPSPTLDPFEAFILVAVFLLPRAVSAS
jgi:hypothetical protein